MARLPIVGQDTGTWGSILNDYLSQVHNTDGTLKDDVVTSASLAPDAVDSTALADNSVAAMQLASSSVTAPKLATTGSPTSGQVLSWNGSALSWATVSGSGSVPDADATTKGILQLAGDLAGTAASPAIASGAVTAGKIANGTITAGKIASGTLTDSEISSSAAIAQSKISGLTAALSAKAVDSAVVHNTGAETVAGVKTFSSSPIVPTPSSGTDAANKTYVDTLGGNYQPLDSDLTAIAALAPTDDDVLQRKSGAWTNRTPAQLKTDLSLTKSDVGLSNVDNTSDATKNSAAVTLTNKKLDSTSTTIADTTDATKQAKFDVSGITTSTIRTLTIPDANLTVVGTATSQTLTNKTLSGASNTFSNIPESAVTNLTSDLSGKATDSAVVHNTGAETVAGVKTFSSSPIVPTPSSGTDAANKSYVDTAGGNYQPLDSDLTAIAAIAPADGDLIRRQSGAWTNQTLSSFKADLFLVKADVGLGNVDNTSDATKNAATATLTNKALDSTTTTVTDTTDATKKFKFDASGITTSTTRTLTIPDASLTVVGTTTTQTLTNKTLSGASNTFSSIPESAITNLTTDLSAKVDKSTLTTKGDLYVATASSTVARQAVGSDNQVLGADSSQTNGVAWRFPFEMTTTKSGAYVQGHSGVSTSSTLGVGTLRLSAWYFGRTTTISQIGAEVSTIGDVGSKFRIGVYADDGNNYPGALALDAGQIAGDSATVQAITLGSSLVLSAGLYWVGGAVQSVTTTQPTIRTGIQMFMGLGVVGTPGAASLTVGYSQTGVSGALPSNFTAFSSSGSIGSAPRIFMKIA